MVEEKKPRKRRPRGSGTIFFCQRRKLYVGRIPIGRKPGGGTLYVEVSDPRQNECVAKMRAVKPTPRSGVTVADWSRQWLASIEGRSPLYRDICERSVRLRINPVLGHVRLCDLTTFIVERAIQEWGRQLAPNTVLMTTRNLGSLLQSAVRAELIARNPVSSARKPSLPRRRVEPFSPAELNRIIATAATRPVWRPLALLAATGMRMGELVGLDASDYNPATGMLSISKAEKLHYGIGPTKTQNSVRTIRVPEQVQGLLAMAKDGRGRGPLFVRNGRRQSRFSLRKAWDRVLRACDLPRRTPHALRHSVCSIMIAAGVPIPEVGRFLGDSPATLYKVYAHATTGGDAGREMGRILSQGQVRKHG